MDVNKHERLSNITLKVKEQCFYCCSTFHSHNSFLDNQHKLSTLCLEQ